MNTALKKQNTDLERTGPGAWISFNKKQPKETVSLLNKLQATNDALDKSQAVIEFDLQGNILNANENFTDTMGYRLDEIIGAHHSMFAPHGLAQSAEYKNFWHKLAAGEFISGEFQRIDAKGNSIWLQASYNPIFDKDGIPEKVIKFASDITAQKRRTADFEGQLKAINRSQAVISFSTDGIIMDANENFLAAMGYEAKEIIGKHHRIFVDPEYARSREYQQFWDRLREGEFQSAEFNRFTKSNDEIWIQASYNPIYGASGKLVKIVKFATDITQQKTQSANDKGLVEAISRSQAIIEFDPNGIILNANENFLNTVGYGLNDIIGQHHRIFVEPEYAQSTEYKQFWHQLQSGQYDSGEYERVSSNGEKVWLQASYNPIFDPKGRLVKIVKFATNITEQVSIRSQNEVLSLVANETDNAVLITDANGITEYVNPGFTKMTGFTESQILGQKPGNVLQGEATSEESKKAIRTQLNAGQPFYTEILNYTAAGSPYWISLSVNPVRNRNGIIDRFVSINADVTETKTKALEFNMRMNAIQAANMVAEWHADGALKMVNSITEEILGTTKIEDLNMLFKFSQLVSQQDREILGKGEPIVRDIETFDNEGNQVFMSATFAPVTDFTGAITQFVMYATDTSARRKAVNTANSIMKSVISDIATIASEISSVSLQTKLLSLNAGVEAARAGEAGKGFGIVTGEVRELAEKTRESMQKIDDLLKQTKTEIKELQN